jgi:hypothetical protein
LRVERWVDVRVTPELTEMVRPTRSSSRKRAASPLPADDGESAASTPADASQRAGKRTKSNEPPGLEPIPCAATAITTATSADVHSEAPGVGSGAVASANDTTGHVHGASVGDGAAVRASFAAASSVNVDAACNDGARAGAIAGAAAVAAPVAIDVAPMLVAPSALNATQQHTAVDHNPTAESGVMAVAGGTKVFAGAAARLAWADRTSTHTPAGARAGAAAPAASAPSSSSAAASAPPPPSSTLLRGAAESAVVIGATHVLEADKKDVRAGGRAKLEFDAEAYKTAMRIVNAGVHRQQWWMLEEEEEEEEEEEDAEEEEEEVVVVVDGVGGGGGGGGR